ncbi:MAG: ComEC/Rec2 family competence protein [Clostridiales bacterium]|nr:ComEC/Rec2 family competence protein [Clostridiales bacterium]
MKRAVNFRSFVYSAAILMLTILLCLLALNLAWLGFSLLLIAIFAPVILAIIFKKKLLLYKFVTIIMTACLCFVAVVMFFITVYSWTPSEVGNRVYWVSGTVDDNFVVDGERKVILKNLQLDNMDVPGRMQITVSDEEKFFELIPVGDRLEFAAYVFVRDLVSGYSINASYLRSNIRYVATVTAGNVKISEGKTTLLDDINSFVKNTLIECMGNRYGVIAYGILTGDKNEISSDVRDSFSAAGIAHILAVSGLHIGFLMAIMTFLLRKFKVKRLPTFITNAVILLLYTIFAGFSPSVVRASIMFLVLSGATLLGEQNDSFNSLGLASTVILTVSPVMLFEGGFVMSIGAVFGLINFTPLLVRLLTKIKMNEKIANAIAVPVAAQLGVLPVSVNFFGSLQLYSIIINIVLMPFMSLVFMAVFVSVLLSIIPPLKILVTLSGFLIKGLTIAADFCSALPLAQLTVSSTLISFLLFPLYFVVGEFFNCKHKKIVMASCGCVAILLIIILAIL